MRPVVRSRIALEGLTIERTVAAALRAPTSRAQGGHRRGARGAHGNQLSAAVAQARRGGETIYRC